MPTECWIRGSLVNVRKQLGIVVSDQTVKNLISALGGDRVPLATIKTIISNMRLGQRQLIEALRSILLAQRVRSMFVVATGGLTPAQRWDYYQRLRRTATVELAAVPVEKFTNEVKDPGDAALAKFFESHKDRIHDPDLPEPGFRESEKIAFTYFKADVANFVDPKSVSDAEVQTYYNDHKQQFVNSVARIPAPDDTAARKPLPPKPTAPKLKPEAKTDGPQGQFAAGGHQETAPPEQKKPAAEPDVGEA